MPCPLERSISGAPADGSYSVGWLSGAECLPAVAGTDFLGLFPICPRSDRNSRVWHASSQSAVILNAVKDLRFFLPSHFRTAATRPRPCLFYTPHCCVIPSEAFFSGVEGPAFRSYFRIVHDSLGTLINAYREVISSTCGQCFLCNQRGRNDEAKKPPKSRANPHRARVHICQRFGQAGNISA